MTQVATVERILDGEHAEISVPRKSACGHDCEECAGCGVSGASVHAKARNPIGAQPGEKVVVESDTGKMLKIVALVYMTPVVLFFLGYLLSMPFFPPLLSGVAGGVGFLAGILAAVAYDRRLRRRGGLDFTIVRLF